MKIFIVLVSLMTVKTDSEEQCKAPHSCKLEDLGCFNDQDKRALPVEILNERDVTSKVFGGTTIDWANFNKYLQGFACRCAKIASSKGYSVIGLQFYGECWSGRTAHMTYHKYGKSKKCIDGNFRSITDSSRPTCGHYVGTQWTNHVYRIATPGCTQHQIEPIGCFHDDMIAPRPVPNYIMNERDRSDKSWNGKLIDWKNWKTYSPQLICRCAEAASKIGHRFFAIQFWGECWSGKDANVHYNRNGGSPNCVNENFKACSCNSYNCIGMAHTNYVYRLHGRVKCNM